MTRTYEAEFLSVAGIPATTLEQMAALYFKYYAGSSKRLFYSDFYNKTEALLVYCNRDLIGFSTQDIYGRNIDGWPVRVIYSGDTVVDRAHWGQQALAFAWIERAGQIKCQQPDVPLFWLLIVKGHRTYRYLPAFSRSFYPHWSEYNAGLKGMADQLALDKFGADYDPTTGVVAYEQSRGHLKEAYASPDQGEMEKPSVRFFLERNPGYLHGHELVCLCELNEQNLKPLSRRIFKRAGK